MQEKIATLFVSQFPITYALYKGIFFMIPVKKRFFNILWAVCFKGGVFDEGEQGQVLFACLI